MARGRIRERRHSEARPVLHRHGLAGAWSDQVDVVGAGNLAGGLDEDLDWAEDVERVGAFNGQHQDVASA